MAANGTFCATSGVPRVTVSISRWGRGCRREVDSQMTRTNDQTRVDERVEIFGLVLEILRRTPEISTGEAWDIEYLQMKVAEIWIGHLNRQADLS